LSIIEVIPTLNVPSYFVLQFGNKLSTDKTFVSTNLDDYIPAIYSNTFTFGGKEVFVRDNGSGQLNLYETVDGSIKLVKANVGTVDYDTGDVIVKYITVQSYTGSGIKLYARLSNKDVIAPKDRILSIRPEDVSIAINGIRE